MPFGYWPYRRDFFPFSFAVEDQYLHGLWGHGEEDPSALLAWDDGAGRDVPVFSSLRQHPATYEGARANVTRWLKEMAIEGSVVRTVDIGTRSGAGKIYWAFLKQARIVVTANPSKWEGDFRYVRAWVK